MIKKFILSTILFFVISLSVKLIKPCNNGRLQVRENRRYLQFENGKLFFWLGDTGWLLPERLDRDEVKFYLDQCAEKGYNVVQIQTINAVPAYNYYSQSSMPNGFDFKNIDKKGIYGYWNHVDYIIKIAQKKGIYIAMDCIWGGLEKSGLMNEHEAIIYGTFLAERYKNSPNIIWVIGGDIRGDVRTEVWEALANTIKSIDKNHLMTFHSRGRTCSSAWLNDDE